MFAGHTRTLIVLLFYSSLGHWFQLVYLLIVEGEARVMSTVPLTAVLTSFSDACLHLEVGDS